MNSLKTMAIGTLSMARKLLKAPTHALSSQCALKALSEAEANSGFLSKRKAVDDTSGK